MAVGLVRYHLSRGGGVTTRREGRLGRERELEIAEELWEIATGPTVRTSDPGALQEYAGGTP